MHCLRYSLPIAAAISLLAQVLLAQDPSVQDEAFAPLTIRTTDPTIARGVLRVLESGAELPELGSGKVLVISLDDGGEAVVETADGEGWLEVDLQPGLLMDIFGDRVAQGRQSAEVFGGMALTQQGYEYEDVQRMVGALFEFPRQIQRARLRLPTRFEVGQLNRISLQLTPVPQSWFASLCGNLKPNPAGHPDVGRGRLADAAVSIDLSAVMPQIEPIVSVMAGTGQADEESRELFRTFALTQWKALDGTMAMAFSRGQGLRAVYGLLDAAPIAAIWSDPKWVELTLDAMDAAGGDDVKIENDYLVHRDVSVLKTTMTLEDIPAQNPFVPDGQVRTYQALVGKRLAMTMLSGDDDIKALIDDLADGQIPTGQLPENELGRVRIDVFGFLDMAMEMVGGPIPDANEVPETVDVHLFKTVDGVSLEVQIK